MSQLKHNGVIYNVYFDAEKQLDFIMEEKEVIKFQKLVKKHHYVENISESELLTGTYLHQVTKKIEGFECNEIKAKMVKFKNHI